MPKNKSEMLLEGYLRSNGYADFDYEPEIAGTTKRPDYRLCWRGGEVLLEVKEFRGTEDDFKAGAGFYDPCVTIDRGRANASTPGCLDGANLSKRVEWPSSNQDQRGWHAD
jgi:hypothetical protein